MGVFYAITLLQKRRKILAEEEPEEAGGVLLTGLDAFPGLQREAAERCRGPSPSGMEN